MSKKQWPFAPQSLGNCILWLDAADTSSYTPGAAITSWRNKGYGGGSAAGTGTIGSTSANINGLPAMLFAANAYMTAPSITFTQTTRTVFVVVTLGASGSTRNFMAGGANTIDTKLLSINTDLELSQNVTNISYATAAPYPMFNTTSILCGTTLSTNGGLFINGLAQTPYSPSTPFAYATGATTTQLIGNSTNAAFIIGEAMIFDGAITDIQRQQIEGYLAAKWGLQSFLPASHPYFTLYNLNTTSFTPTQVPTCALWLDASDATSIVGTTVARWLDKSGNGNNGIPISSGPTLVQNVQNGLPGLTFPTTASIMLCGNLLAGTNYSMLAVVKYDSTGNQFAVNEWKVQFGSYLVFNTNRSIAASVSATATASIFGPSVAADRTAFHIYAASLTSSTSSSSATLIAGTDGNDATYTSTGGPNTAATAQPFSVGGDYESGIGYFPLTGYVCEVIVYNTTLTANQLKQVESYLGTKWGIPVAGQGTVAPVASPLVITGCQLWLDASDAASIVPVVSTWRDKSGLSNNMALTTGVVTYVSNPGPPCVNFASGGVMTSVNSTAIVAATSFVFIVCQTTVMNAAVSDYVFACPNINPSGNLGDYSIRFTALTTINNANSNDISFGTGYYINGVLNNSSSVTVPTGYNIVGGLMNASGTTTFSLSTSFLSRYFIGNIREVIVYTGPITATQRLQVENYLMAKWGCGRNLWIDASDATTINNTATTTTLGSWADKSGNGNSSVSLGTAAPIITSNAINGRQAISFPNAGTSPNPTYFFDGPISLTGASITYFVVGTLFNTAVNVTGTSPRFLSLAATGQIDYNNPLYIAALYTSLATVGAYRNNGGGAPASVVSNTPYIFSAIATNTAVALYQNGGTVMNITTGTSPTTPTTFTVSRFRVANDFNPGNQLVNGYIGEVIVYNTTLTTTQRQQIETYLGSKWGITVGTPVSGITNPASVTGCQLWLDGQDPYGTNTNTTVLQWRDKSGNGNNATAVGKPVVTTNAINGIQAMYLANAPYFTGPISITGTTLTCFAVATTLATMPNNLPVHDQRLISLASGANVDYGRTDGAIGLFNQYNTSTIATYRATGPLAANAIVTGTPFIAVSKYDGTNAFLWYNGAAGSQPSSASSGTFAITKYGISNQANPQLEYWYGYIGEIIIYNTALTDTQRQQVETYLANKWGLSVANTVLGVTNPTIIPGCQLWLDAADSTTITTAVYQITDKSGNGYNLTQAAATYQPALSNNYLTMGTSLNSYLNMPQAAINNTTSWTLFLVFNPSSSSNWIMAKQFDGTNSYNVLSMTYSAYNVTGTTGVVYFKSLNAGTLFTGPAALTTSTNQLLTMIYNGSNIYYYINGVLLLITNGTFAIQSQTGATNATLGAYIVSSAFTNSGVTNFQLGELDFYNSALTTTQIQQLEVSLMNKWGITNAIQTANGSLLDTPFLPTDITGCAAWYDGADSSSFTMTGTAITAWADKSGNGKTATGVNSPTYSASSLGVVMNGTTNCFTTTVTVPTATHCLIAVHNPTTITGSSVGNTSLFRFQNTNYISFPYMNTTTPRGYINSQDGTTTAFNTSVLVENSAINTPNVIIANISATSQTIYKNGVVQSTGAGTLTNVTSDTLTIGRAVTTEFYQGTIYEMIVYNITLTNAQIQAVTKYLQSKWNTALTVTTIPTPVFNRPFQPTDIAGCGLWLDGADQGSMTFSGTSITQWNDKSGNGYNATVASGRTAAVFSTAFNCVNFNSQTNGYVTSFPANPTNETMFVVANNGAPSGANNTIIGGQLGARSLGFGLSGNGGAISGRHGYLQNEVQWLAATGNGTYTSGTTALCTGYITGGNTYISANGGSFSAAFPINGGVFAAGTTTYLAVDTTSTAYYFVGYAMEIIFYNSVLTSIQIKQVEAYLAWKWGITSTITAGHPGKTLPPFSTIFTPKSISGLQWWLDGADPNATGIPPANGAIVSTWNDKSGNGYNATATGSPTYSANVQNKLGVPFLTTGTSYYTAPSFVASSTGAPTFFIVMKQTSYSGTGNSDFFTTTSSYTFFDMFGQGGAFNIALCIYGSTTQNILSLNNVTNVSPQLVSVVGTTAQTSAACYTNGAFYVTASGGGSGLNVARIWRLGSGPGFLGYVYEVLIYNTALTTSQRQQVEGYLAWKWGLQANLPTSHSYKKFSP